ncbi:A24 family peptidase [Fontisubflavum oceani]|uniref:prepilin peptidase n=1 Tax=Fontisubflavum oceani TaxID=2978973 RepID=UPI0025B2BBB8|nr:A24 family peptidase [Fontisubflavum oceani]WJY20391.1 A24 family peptidase [Fontisubflavum oceani]
MKLAKLILMHVLAYGAILALLWSPLDLWGFLLAGLLIWVSVIDIRRYEIPDGAVVALLFLGLLLMFQSPVTDRVDLLAGVLIWPAVFWLTATVYRAWRGYDGLGFGDIKLVAGLGSWLGLSGMTFVVLIASISGILTLLASMLVRRSVSGEVEMSGIAFGPFLNLSAWAVWLLMRVQ